MQLMGQTVRTATMGKTGVTVLTAGTQWMVPTGRMALTDKTGATG